MKINIKNFELLKNGGLNLSPRAKSGILLGVFFLGFGIVQTLQLNKTDSDSLDNETLSSLSDYVNNAPSNDFSNEIIDPYYQEDPINVSLEEINSLNIIINDCNCGEEFFTKVCDELENDGIKFTLTSDCENINVNGAVIITLDQQYMAGPGTAILAPFENNRLGNSDALAIAAWRAFYEKGFIADEVTCGKMGFMENEDGTVSERTPTNTEKNVDKNTAASFVTISFGTQNAPASLVANAIENMLVRFYSYNEQYDSNDVDLIYCVQKDDSYDSVSKILGTTKDKIIKYNDTIDNNMLLPGEAIINPNVESIRPFNQHVPVNLYIEKTLWSK